MRNGDLLIRIVADGPERHFVHSVGLETVCHGSQRIGKVPAVRTNDAEKVNRAKIRLGSTIGICVNRK